MPDRLTGWEIEKCTHKYGGTKSICLLSWLLKCIQEKMFIVAELFEDSFYFYLNSHRRSNFFSSYICHWFKASSCKLWHFIWQIARLHTFIYIHRLYVGEFENLLNDISLFLAVLVWGHDIHFCVRRALKKEEIRSIYIRI